MAVSCLFKTRPKLPRNKYGNNNGNYTTVSSVNYSGSSSSSGGSSGGSSIVFSGATSSSPGTAGVVPAPSAGSQDSFLKGNATWTRIPAFELTAFDTNDPTKLRFNSDVVFSGDSYSYGTVTAYQFQLQDGTIITPGGGGSGDTTAVESLIYTSAFVSGQIDTYLNSKINDTYSYFTNVINSLIGRIEALENRQ